MRVPRLPLVAELRDRALLTVEDKDRVEAEAASPARLHRDPAREHAGPAQLVTLRRERDQLADVARPATVAVHITQLPQQPPDLVAGGPPRGGDARPAVETDDLDPGVLADHPRGGVADAASEARLAERVVVARRAVFRP